MYKFRDERQGREDGVPVELALDHRSPYLVMVVGQPADGTTLDDVDAWFAARPLGAEVVAEFTPIPMHAGAPSDVPRDEAENRFLRLYFVDDDLPDRLGGALRPPRRGLRRAGLGELVFVSPFRATVPGHRHVHRPALVSTAHPGSRAEDLTTRQVPRLP